MSLFACDLPDGEPMPSVSATMWTWCVRRSVGERYGLRRWWWDAVGPVGGRGGFAGSRAVAENRAKRALLRLGGPAR